MSVGLLIHRVGRWDDWMILEGAWTSFGTRCVMATLLMHSLPISLVILCAVAHLSWWVRAFSACSEEGAIACDVIPYEASMAKSRSIVGDIIFIFSKGDSVSAGTG